MLKKILYTILLLVLLSPLVVGLILPKERVVSDSVLINKMYFFVLSDVANHYEESAWRSNIDTLMPRGQIDGQEAWVEYYTNGDSVVWKVQRLSETDYVRVIIKPDGHECMRGITIADVQGRTAVRYSEEVYETNPLKRFATLFKDKDQERAHQYLFDLAEKHKPDPNAPEEDNMGW